MRSTVITGRSRTTRRYSLLGACGLLAIIVIQVPSLADLWRQMKSQQAENARMLAGLAETEKTQELAKQLSEVQQEMQAIEQTMVGVEQMQSIQSELMELARECGCQLRKAAIQSGSSLTWEAEREEQAVPEPDLPAVGTESPYRLTTEQLGLTLTGTLTQTLEFLDRIRQKPWLLRVAQINLSRDGESRGQMIVDANLAFHKLVRQEKSELESMPWREGSRLGKIQ